MNRKIVSLLLLAIFVLPVAVLAQGLQNPISASSFTQLLENIATAVAGIVGGVAVIMFIVSGILFLISAGDPAKVTKARDALKYAVMGSVVALGAAGLVALIKNIIGVQ